MVPRRNVRLGQNFLIDKNIARKIVDWAAIDGSDVLEVGPGRAILTDILAERARTLVAVELDPRLAADLQVRFCVDPADRVRIVEGDALKVDLHSLFPGSFSVVANLPYESGTAILVRLIKERPGIRSMVLMLQREVCHRVTAQPGGKEYGRLAVLCGLHTDVEPGRVVHPGSFRPAPKVDSQIIRVTPLSQPRFDVGNEETFEAIVKAAFAGRRKILRNNLGGWLRERFGDDADAMMDEARIDQSSRPETLAIESFAALSKLVSARA